MAQRQRWPVPFQEEIGAPAGGLGRGRRATPAAADPGAAPLAGAGEPVTRIGEVAEGAGGSVQYRVTLA